MSIIYVETSVLARLQYQKHQANSDSNSNWDSLHARLNSHQNAWSYKKKKHKKIEVYRKSLQKEPTVNGCLLILDLKPFRLQFKGKHSIGRGFQSCMQTHSACCFAISLCNNILHILYLGRFIKTNPKMGFLCHLSSVSIFQMKLKFS